MRRVLNRAAAVGAAAAVLALGMSVLGVSAASASTIGGVATINNTAESAALTGPQASSQPFSIGLPSGAACDGDTLNHGYAVVSYMVPQSVYPSLQSAVTFVGGTSNVGLGYFTAGGTELTAQNTAPTTGQILTNVDGPWQWATGLVPGLLSVTGSLASPYQQALIPTGSQSQVWETGIACINSSGAITDYWNAEITFNTSTSDTNGFTWTPTTTTGANVPESPLNVALPIGGGMILVGALFVTWRRRRGTSIPESVTVA